jgi:ferredoxin
VHKTRLLIQFVSLTAIVVGVFILQNHCELWCPFGGAEGIHAYITEGSFTCSLGVRNLFALGGLLVSVLLLRRAFCGYLCPIGTLSNWFSILGEKLHLPKLTVPAKLDRALSLIKYPLTVLILYLTWQAGEVIFRAFCPAYAAISRHGEDITFWAYIVLGSILVFSLFLTMPFCRWFCPLAALIQPFSKIGLTRVRRDQSSCTDCTKCAQACPMAIPVDKVDQVRSARCIGCLECVEACPKSKEKALAWGPPRWLGPAWPNFVLVILLTACLTGVVAGAYWFPLPSFVKTRGEQPETVATIEMEIENCGCRGNANQLWYFLTRDDLFELSDYLRLEAWPNPATARIRIVYDPSQTDGQTIKMAIVEPYLEINHEFLRSSPFVIPGFQAPDATTSMELDLDF